MLDDCALLDWLAGEVAVVSMAATDAAPPLIYELTVSHLSGGSRTGVPWTVWVLPDSYEADVPCRAWPTVRQAPPWDEVADWIATMLGARTILVYDQHADTVLRMHLPDYPFPRILHATEIAARAWPDLNRALRADRSLRPPLPRYRPPASAQDAAMTELIARVLISASSRARRGLRGGP